MKTHWSIENSLHWILDAAFREDESRVRTSHMPRNLCLLRCMALNLLRQNTAVQAGVVILLRQAGRMPTWSKSWVSPNLAIALRAVPGANVGCRLL